MASTIFDDTNPFPANGEVTGFDLAVIDLDVTGDLAAAIQVTDTAHVFIRKDRIVTGQNDGLHLLGTSGIVTNEGTIESQAETNGAAIRFAATGTHTVNNSGTIKAKGLAIEGNAGSDRIINTHILQTTSNAANAVLLDLKDGDDFYDGILGQATGGVIKLGKGDDKAYGGAGAETFVGGEGNDTLDGGGGDDTADYSEATGAMYIDLTRTESAAFGGGQGSDTLLNIENAVGGMHNDTIVGSVRDNTLQGGKGNDTLEGGLGNDRLEGGEGTDTARYTGAGAATVDLSNSGAQNTGGYGSDTLIGIENLEGGSGADKFTGNDDNNKLVGNGGNDTLIGGKGNDTLDGGTGVDTVVFSGTRADYTITHNADGSVTIVDIQGAQRNGTDLLKDIRFAKFSDQTFALVNGNPSSIFLSTSTVQESTQVGATVATLFGSDPDGDDLTYSLSSNPDGLFGLDSTGEKIILAKALDYEKTAQHTISVTATDAYGGTYTKTFTINVRNVVETTPLTRYGTAKAEQLTGEAGNDRLFGLGGNDTLFGEIGADTLTGGAGNDTLVGGTGGDVFVFDKKPSVKSNLDYIQDFVPKDDVIHLSRSVFKISKGTLSKKAFVVGDHFKDKDDRILHLKKQGALFYDPDGSGPKKAIQFANLSRDLKISHKDFFVF